MAFDYFRIFGLFSFALGACIASFLNVCIWRLPRNESVVRPASHCPNCNAPIRWYQKIERGQAPFRPQAGTDPIRPRPYSPSCALNSLTPLLNLKALTLPSNPHLSSSPAVHIREANPEPFTCRQVFSAPHRQSAPARQVLPCAFLLACLPA